MKERLAIRESGWTSRLREVSGYCVGPVVALATTPLLAHELGPSGRGQLAVVLAVVSICAVIGELGQPEIYMKRYRETSYSLASSVYISLASSTFMAIIGAGYLITGDFHPGEVLLAILFIPAFALTNIWRTSRLIAGDTTSPMLAAALAAVLRLGALSVAWTLGHVTLSVVVLVYQATQVLGPLLVSLPRVKLFAVASWRENFFTWPTVFQQARAGTQIWIFHVSTAVTLRADILILSALASPHEVGIYAAAVGLSQTGLVLSVVFKTRVQSLILSRQPLMRIRQELRAIAILGLPPVIFVMVFAPWITNLLLGREFAESASILRLLMVVAISQIALDLVQGLLVAMGALKELTFNACAGAILTTASLLAFVPHFGAFGAAVASLISYSVVASLGGYQLKQKLNEIKRASDNEHLGFAVNL